MSHVGMYQPIQKDGENWAVDFVVIHGGEELTKVKKFRVRKDAQAFVSKLRKLTASTETSTELVSVKITNIEV
jgi:hypothetical protein